MLEIFRRCIGPSSIYAVRNEGLFRVDGCYYDILSFCRIELENVRSAYGENHRYTAMAYNNLALSLNGTGDCYEALECYRKAISIYENMPEKTI